VQVNRAGKIAMKLDEGDSIIGVGLCTTANDVLLTSSLGRCIRFPVDEVRVFAGRESTGVRGVRLVEGDTVISMAILHGVDATPAERGAYLKHANAMRAAQGGEAEEIAAAPDEDEAAEDQVSLSLERIVELSAAEEFILTVSTEGFGKRTSAYEYRRTGRGGQGLIAHDLTKKGGRLVASFPVEDTDGILLVTDQGKLIRVPVDDIRIAGRNTSGVTIFRTAEDEHVVGVDRLEGDGGESEADDEDDSGDEDGTGEA
jgi:DNA gyrase subunit A